MSPLASKARHLAEPFGAPDRLPRGVWGFVNFPFVAALPLASLARRCIQPLLSALDQQCRHVQC